MIHPKHRARRPAAEAREIERICGDTAWARAQIIDVGAEDSPIGGFSVKRRFVGSQPSLDHTRRTLNRKFGSSFRLFSRLGITLVTPREGRLIVGSSNRPFEEVEDRASLAIEGMDPLVVAMITGVTTLGNKKGRGQKSLALTLDDDARDTILGDRTDLLMPLDPDEISDDEFTPHASIGTTRDAGVAAEAEAVAGELVPGKMFMFFGKAVFSTLHDEQEY